MIQFIKDNLVLLLVAIVLVGGAIYIASTPPKEDQDAVKVIDKIDSIVDKVIDKVEE